MRFLSQAILCSLLLIPFTIWAEEQSLPAATVDKNQAADANAAFLLGRGISLVRTGEKEEAIGEFDKIIQSFEARYNNPKMKYFSARSPTESLLYLVEAANKDIPTQVTSMYWAYAYDSKSYALTDLGRPQEALQALQAALVLSPHNSQFLSELGYYYETQKNWSLALSNFQQGAEMAKSTSPENVRNTDLARAWRGTAYVYVEQGHLDDAEKIYQQCLDLDKNDTKAVNELGYIQKLRANQNH